MSRTRSQKPKWTVTYTEKDGTKCRVIDLPTVVRAAQVVEMCYARECKDMKIEPVFPDGYVAVNPVTGED